MPSRAWVVTGAALPASARIIAFQCPHGLELLLRIRRTVWTRITFQCPHGLELLHYWSGQNQATVHRFNALTGLSCYVTGRFMYSTAYMFQCPHGLELLRSIFQMLAFMLMFQCPHGLELLLWLLLPVQCQRCFNALTGLSCYIFPLQVYNNLFTFQCPHGLELLRCCSGIE